MMSTSCFPVALCSASKALVNVSTPNSASNPASLALAPAFLTREAIVPVFCRADATSLSFARTAPEIRSAGSRVRSDHRST